METPAILQKTAGQAGLNIIGCVLIAGQGSNRQYYRLHTSQGQSLIGTIGPDVQENRTFVNLSRLMRGAGIAVPDIVAVSSGCEAYIQSDLGSVSLFDAIAASRTTGDYSTDDFSLLVKAIETLAEAHSRGSFIADNPDNFYPARQMGEREIMWDLNYFKYCFLKPLGITFDESRLEDDFNTLTGACICNYNGLMLRDYQSRNIMLHEGHAYIIDYQGARLGPWAYDIVSLLWQARANIPAETRRKLIDMYVSMQGIDAELFMSDVRRMVILRTLQVLGAYGFRGYVEHKEHFIASIPGAITNLREVLADQQYELPGYLRSILSDVCAMPQFSTKGEQLTVTVRSFSFKKGRPDDSANVHGGGFTFDCRALHNPGRYEPYKQLNGLDQPVIDFMERYDDVREYINHVEALVDSTVEVYLRRGFDSLTVDFGCTGGQHRSVYNAHHLARHLWLKYNVHVIERHCVQQIVHEYTPRCKD